MRTPPPQYTRAVKRAWEPAEIAFGCSLLLLAGGAYAYYRYRKHKSAYMLISLKAIDFILREEDTSREFYQKNEIHPTWPQGDSGITIGIGYDLGYHSRAEITRDWNQLGADQVAVLQSAAGLQGTAARDFLAGNAKLRAITIPYDMAVGVFVNRSLPKAAREALSIYPGLEQLLPDAVGGIVSMVFNRGSGLVGDRRKEMRAIVPLVASKDYAGIAAQVESSKRLWVASGMKGLVDRRVAEAALIRGAIHQYGRNENLQLPMAA